MGNLTAKIDVGSDKFVFPHNGRIYSQIQVCSAGFLFAFLILQLEVGSTIVNGSCKLAWGMLQEVEVQRRLSNRTKAAVLPESGILGVLLQALYAEMIRWT